MNKFGKFLLCLTMPVLMAGTGCGIYYGIQYHNLDKQSIEDDSGMVNVVDELRKSVESLEKEKETLTKQLSALQGQYDALNQLRQNLEDTNSTLETENAELQTQLSELNNQNAQLETQITNLNNQIISLNTQIETLNKTLEDNKNASDEEITFLELEITSLNNQILSLHSDINALNNSIDNYEANTIALNTEIANLNNRITEYEQEIENYKQIIENLKKINSCVVTFIVDGELYNTQQVNKTESPVAIDNPASESYIFDGWTIAGSTDIVNPFTFSVTEDIEFVASIRKYKVVTFTVDGQVVSTQRILSNNELEIPSTPSKEFSIFLGWSLDGTNIIDLSSYSIVQDVNFVAVFENVAGLYNENNELQYSWNDLIENNFLATKEGALTYGTNRADLQALSGTLVIDDKVTSLSSNCFESCINLTKIIIPSSVETISSSVFRYCENIDTIIFKEGSKITSLNDYVFGGCSSLSILELPDGLCSITDTTFDGCSALAYTTYGNATYIGNKDNPYFILYKGILKENSTYKFLEATIHSDTKVIGFRAFSISGSTGSYDFSTIVLPNGLQGISAYAFYGACFTNITIPSSVKYIGQACFHYNQTLETIEFEENSQLTYLGYGVFENCFKLNNVVLPESLTELRGCTFKKCTALTNVVLPNSLLKLSNSDFSDCTALKTIIIPKSVVEFGYRAFIGCTGLTSVYIPDSVLTISANNSGYGIFFNCSSTLKIYCGASSKPSGWGSYYNYRTSSATYTFKWGYTYEEYLNDIS